MYIHIHIYENTHTKKNTHINTHICTYTFTRTYMYTHTHTHVQEEALQQSMFNASAHIAQIARSEHTVSHTQQQAERARIQLTVRVEAAATELGQLRSRLAQVQVCV